MSLHSVKMQKIKIFFHLDLIEILCSKHSLTVINAPTFGNGFLSLLQPEEFCPEFIA